MPKIVDGETQREEIRSAARSVFAERGVRGTGLAHVAEAAGMGRSSLYHYYPDKAALLSDLVREMLDEELALFRVCLRGQGPPLERIERLARACVSLFPEWATFGRMILDLRLDNSRFVKTAFRGMRRELASAIAEGQSEGSFPPEPSAEVLAAVLIGTIDGLLVQHFVDPRALPRPDEMAEMLCVCVRRIVSP